ncbi:CocE/NonD family hydrolase [Nonomuraea sp. SYSU D8015]|uniref:CocE/NonD family hydrolase n=1 Tax=Nonomuraea sp. SYSU D8015 TaxID=2593644 RepID=UPI001660147D|nr:CocE/NonD family hydrolase [Nonomuraea sp. SYSU D8015]
MKSNLSSRLIRRILRLPAPSTRDLAVQRDMPVPMRDGAVLLADRWAPRSGEGDGLPTALVRIPYGRTGVIATMVARPLAERGFQVLVQSTRGTFGSGGAFDPLRCEREDGLDTLEWGQADVAAIGRHSDYFQACLAHDAESPYWKVLDHSHRVPDISVPVSSVGGWYDIFLPGQLRDHQALQAAGRHARITIGPWPHASLHVTATATAEALDFGLAHARGEKPEDRAPVRLFVMGEEAWRDFSSWPPPGYPSQRFHLQPGGALAADVPGESEPDGYRYDPGDPTPAVGGVRMAMGVQAGRVDNTELEARPDVLTSTTGELARDAEVIGEISAEIWFRSSLPYADVFVRLRDVDAQGRSTNVCDGLISLTGADQTSCATVRLWPTAYRFKRGHRIRVQVSSGAFPRYDRNPGTGEPRATAATLRAADQEVFHDPAHPSAVILPIRQDRTDPEAPPVSPSPDR